MCGKFNKIREMILDFKRYFNPLGFILNNLVGLKTPY